MAQQSVLFKLRGLWIGLVFWAGFSLYMLDHQNVMAAAVSAAGDNGNRVSVSLLVIMSVIAVSAPLVRTWASAYLSASVVHDARLHSDRVVADGPYRHTRNPLYLGTLLI